MGMAYNDILRFACLHHSVVKISSLNLHIYKSYSTLKLRCHFSYWETPYNTSLTPKDVLCYEGIRYLSSVVRSDILNRSITNLECKIFKICKYLKNGPRLPPVV